MAGSFTALPHPGPCILKKHRGQPLRSPTPGGLGIGEKAAGVGAQSPAGCRMPLAEGGGLGHAPLYPAAVEKVATLRGSRLRFQE